MNNQAAAGTAGLEGFKPDFKKILGIVKDIISDPKGCWDRIRGTYSSVKDFYFNFLMVVGAIPPVANFIKGSLIGIDVPFVGSYRTPIVSGFVMMIFQYVMHLIGLYIGAIILSKLAAKFKGRDDLFGALQLIGFAGAPYSVASVLTIIPLGGLLAILVALYGIYIFWQGVTPMTGVPSSDKIAYCIVSIIASFVVFLILGVITTMIMGTLGLMTAAPTPTL